MPRGAAWRASDHGPIGVKQGVAEQAVTSFQLGGTRDSSASSWGPSCLQQELRIPGLYRRGETKPCFLQLLVLSSAWDHRASHFSSTPEHPASRSIPAPHTAPAPLASLQPSLRPWLQHGAVVTLLLAGVGTRLPGPWAQTALQETFPSDTQSEGKPACSHCPSSCFPMRPLQRVLAYPKGRLPRQAPSIHPPLLLAGAQPVRAPHFCCL